jgi:two-component system phosphate regulon response regulator PhoB
MVTMPRVLVIDGDSTERAELSAMLTSAGHEVESAATAATGRLVARASRPDLVVIDLALPDESGAAVCRALRGDTATSGAMLFVLTASIAEADRVLAFESGADDVVTRPYSKRELMLRLTALLRRRRRSTAPPQVLVTVGPLSVDPAARRAAVGGRPLDLTRREFDVLHFLAEGAGRVYTRETLVARLWPDDVDSGRVVDTTMKRLRKKLGDAARLVQTVRGAGYRLGLGDGDADGDDG